MEPTNSEDFDFKEYLNQQLDEIDCLQSIYSRPGELNYERDIIDDLRNYCNGKSLYLPNSVDITVTYNERNTKAEVNFILPSNYPQCPPEVYLRCDDLNRQQQTLFNEELNKQASNNDGSVCLFSIMSFVESEMERFVNLSRTEKTESLNNAATNEKLTEGFSRFWIYSHHIYSKIKRREMLSLSSDLNLTGFCLPGKPGIVCIEGRSRDCEEWWQRIKSMTWKKINVVKREEIDYEGDLEEIRLFESFREISFQNKNPSRTRDHHMDMGEFSKYLDEHKCAGIFKELFGFEGKINAQ